MKGDANLIFDVLRRPEETASIGAADWNILLYQAQASGVLARLALQLEKGGRRSAYIPPRVYEHMKAATRIAAEHERVMRWEVNRIERALQATSVSTVLLKGAAYVMAKLPPAVGRLYSDIDILVPTEKVAIVEAALLEGGWEATNLSEYDQRYYRSWMHELPPLRHRERETIVDVHHTILPRSGRLKPDPALLLQSALPLANSSFKILAPADMVLHSAAHMFQDGQITGALRDLTDLDDLLRYFSKEKNFWDDLVSRSQRMDLKRPLFYALRYTHSLLGTPVPPKVVRACASGSPPLPILRTMDLLVRCALTPKIVDGADWTGRVAEWLLYVRSHWLRMPPFLLGPHLLRKSAKRWVE